MPRHICSLLTGNQVALYWTNKVFANGCLPLLVRISVFVVDQLKVESSLATMVPVVLVVRTQLNLPPAATTTTALWPAGASHDIRSISALVTHSLYLYIFLLITISKGLICVFLFDCRSKVGVEKKY